MGDSNGTPTITLTATDGSLTATDTFDLTVNPINDAPVISNITNQSTNEDTTSSAIAFTITDVDSVLNCATSLSGTSGTAGVVANNPASIVFGGTAPNCTVTLAPVANASGTTTMSITVTDTALTANDTFVLTVNAVNDAPTISNVANQ